MSEFNNLEGGCSSSSSLKKPSRLEMVKAGQKQYNIDDLVNMMIADESGLSTKRPPSLLLIRHPKPPNLIGLRDPTP